MTMLERSALLRRLTPSLTMRFEHGHLEDLVALLLAAREAFVDRSVGKLVVELYDSTLFAHQAQEFGGGEGGQTAVFALSVDSGTHEVDHRHTGNLDGILEGEEDALPGAFLGFHFEEVAALVEDLALCDFVLRVACEDGREGGFAGTIGAHDGMDFTGVDGEVDAAQDLLAGGTGVQVVDFE